MSEAIQHRDDNLSSRRRFLALGAALLALRDAPTQAFPGTLALLNPGVQRNG